MRDILIARMRDMVRACPSLEAFFDGIADGRARSHCQDRLPRCLLLTGTASDETVDDGYGLVGIEFHFIYPDAMEYIFDAGATELYFEVMRANGAWGAWFESRPVFRDMQVFRSLVVPNVNHAVVRFDLPTAGVGAESPSRNEVKQDSGRVSAPTPAVAEVPEIVGLNGYARAG